MTRKESITFIQFLTSSCVIKTAENHWTIYTKSIEFKKARMMVEQSAKTTTK